MCAWLGLPSTFLSLNSQQTLPVRAVSRSSTVPRLLAGATGRSFDPRSDASSFVPAVFAAPAARTAASEAATASVAMSALRMLLLSS
jgi:hypothetical protein